MAALGINKQDAARLCLKRIAALGQRRPPPRAGTLYRWIGKADAGSFDRLPWAPRRRKEVL